ncbi:MAG: hypothetical protein ACJ789_20745 [Thermomicrobiales bacterium]
MTNRLSLCGQLALAEPADHRRRYEVFHLRGAIYADPHSVGLGQHRFRVEWSTAIPLVNSDTSLLNTVMRIGLQDVSLA